MACIHVKHVIWDSYDLSHIDNSIVSLYIVFNNGILLTTVTWTISLEL